MILVDTNVIVDVLKADPQWLAWSSVQLREARLKGPLFINVVVYAELAAHPGVERRVDAFLHDQGFRLRDLSTDCARLAAQAFRLYRQRRGAKTGVLPDFFIGAQAQAEGWPLLTRDASRYRSYFPGLELICP